MYYKVYVWKNDELKKEIYYKADNDIIAMQKASAAIPDGCRATYEEIDEKIYIQETETKIKTETEAQAEV